MSTEFIDQEIWPRLRQLAKKCRSPAVVAVAYFAKEQRNCCRCGEAVACDLCAVGLSCGL